MDQPGVSPHPTDWQWGWVTGCVVVVGRSKSGANGPRVPVTRRHAPAGTCRPSCIRRYGRAPAGPRCPPSHQSARPHRGRVGAVAGMAPDRARTTEVGGAGCAPRHWVRRRRSCCTGATRSAVPTNKDRIALTVAGMYHADVPVTTGQMSVFLGALAAAIEFQMAAVPTPTEAASVMVRGNQITQAAIERSGISALSNRLRPCCQIGHNPMRLERAGDSPEELANVRRGRL